MWCCGSDGFDQYPAIGRRAGGANGIGVACQVQAVLQGAGIIAGKDPAGLAIDDALRRRRNVTDDGGHAARGGLIDDKAERLVPKAGKHQAACLFYLVADCVCRQPAGDSRTGRLDVGAQRSVADEDERHPRTLSGNGCQHHTLLRIEPPYHHELAIGAGIDRGIACDVDDVGQIMKPRVGRQVRPEQPRRIAPTARCSRGPGRGKRATSTLRRATQPPIGLVRRMSLVAVAQDAGGRHRVERAWPLPAVIEKGAVRAGGEEVVQRADHGEAGAARRKRGRCVSALV